jgi:hypothetical protein
LPLLMKSLNSLTIDMTVSTAPGVVWCGAGRW